MTVAAIPVYVLYSHILVPVRIVGCPLSHPSTECNMVDEPACNPCPELLIGHGVFVPVLLPHHTATVSLPSSPVHQTRVSGSFCPPTHFWFLCGSQPATGEPAASSRAYHQQ